MKRASGSRIRPWAIVEISVGSDEGKRTELIRAAYRSSRSGLVALALRGVTRQLVDRALDPVVDARKDLIRGVVYVDADESTEDLLIAATHASVVVASTDRFRDALAQQGIQAFGVEDGARALLLEREPR
ncbi:MAG TPA: hypothetical protein VGD49_10645 [Longimicrobiales bacterium]